MSPEQGNPSSSYWGTHPIRPPEGRWERVSVDFIVELPDSHGFDAIMVVVDSVTKRPHFIPTNTTVSSEGAARLYYQHVWKLHGLPLEWLHDRGSVFISEFMKELNRLLGIKTSASTAYHPQSDVRPSGSTRNSRRTSGCSATTTRTTGTNSFLQRNSRAQTTSMPQPKSLPLSRTRAGTLRWALNRTWMLQTRMRRLSGIGCRKDWRKRRQHSSRLRTSMRGTTIDDATRLRSIEPGDMVLLDASDIRTNRVSKKLDCIRLGPFEVEAAIGNSAYRLKLLESMRRLHPVFPVVKLFPLPPDPFPGRRQPAAPDPIIIDGENYYEVRTDSRLPGPVSSDRVPSSSRTDTTTRTTSGFLVQLGRRGHDQGVPTSRTQTVRHQFLEGG